MKKNWLAGAEVNAVRNGARRVAAAWARQFRQRPLVADEKFQDADEPYPGHWRRFPEQWPAAGPAQRATTQAAVDELPDTWRRVLLDRDVLGRSDAQIAAELDLSVDQERDILTEARAAVRARLDAMQSNGDQQ
jgi:DNA-directed RNA polymerase specialized sigma24 family protein